MNTPQLLDSDWPLVLSLLPADLDASAKQFGAITRKRKVQDAETLLRLGLAYGMGGLSLRETVAWAHLNDVADLSDVALLKRLRTACDWFGWLVAQKLAPRPLDRAALPACGRVRLLDATTVSRPGSVGTDWRLHVGFDLHHLRIDHVQITDAHGGETLTRLPVQPGDIVLGDRGYAHRAGICALAAQQAQLVVRLNCHNVPLQRPDGTPLVLLDTLRGLPYGGVCDLPVQTAPDTKTNLPAVAGRLVALRKSPDACAASRAKMEKQARKKGKPCSAATLEAAEYILLFTTLSQDAMPGAQILELYRFRWQIELAFKRMKGIVLLDEMAAKEPALCRVFLLMQVLALLLLDDLRCRWAAFSPWGYGTPAPSVPVAAVPRPAANLARRRGSVCARPTMGGAVAV